MFILLVWLGFRIPYLESLLWTKIRVYIRFSCFLIRLGLFIFAYIYGALYFENFRPLINIFVSFYSLLRAFEFFLIIPREFNYPA